MKRHRRDYEMMADMNLTNLLDTAFVLLIAFIMASPTMRQGLDVNLPQLAGDSQIRTMPDSQPVTISIKKQKNLPGEPEWIYFGEARVELTDLPALLNDKMKNSSDPTKKMDVYIAMDKEGRYDILAKVLATLKSLHIDNVGLPMLPEDFEQDNAALNTTKKAENGKDQKKSAP